MNLDVRAIHTVIDLIDDIFLDVLDESMFLAVSVNFVYLKMLISKSIPELSDRSHPTLYRALQ